MLSVDVGLFGYQIAQEFSNRRETVQRNIAYAEGLRDVELERWLNDM